MTFPYGRIITNSSADAERLATLNRADAVELPKCVADAALDLLLERAGRRRQRERQRNRLVPDRHLFDHLESNHLVVELRLLNAAQSLPHTRNFRAPVFHSK